MIAVEVKRLPNGYWQASVDLPFRGRVTESSFHDEAEARYWGCFTVSWARKGI